MKYDIEFTGSFKKDIKRAKKQNKDLDKLFKVIENIANGEKLDEKYRDHALKGKFEGSRKCNVEPDWLLIYEIYDNILMLMLYRVGSHSDLFKM